MNTLRPNITKVKLRLCKYGAGKDPAVDLPDEVIEQVLLDKKGIENGTDRRRSDCNSVGTDR